MKPALLSLPWGLRAFLMWPYHLQLPGHPYTLLGSLHIPHVGLQASLSVLDSLPSSSLPSCLDPPQTSPNTPTWVFPGFSPLPGLHKTCAFLSQALCCPSTQPHPPADRGHWLWARGLLSGRISGLRLTFLVSPAEPTSLRVSESRLHHPTSLLAPPPKSLHLRSPGLLQTACHREGAEDSFPVLFSCMRV